MGDRQVKVRIAPSPTGDPHVGTAYVALFNYVFAKQQGGKFILRIEDTDRARTRSSSEENIRRSLRWLGLEWDEGPDCGGPSGPYRQSERESIYKEHAQILVDKGQAYPCFCTPERLDAMRKAQKEQGKSTGYDGHCRELSAEEVARRYAAGEPAVIRLRIPEGESEFIDELRGPIKIDHSQVDDQVLMKTDGFPTYHLANVVDDHLMGVTHVIRAEEWLSSVPKHVLLYKAFGWEEPTWVHLSLLRNADKAKISKRKNPVSLTLYEQIGYLPEAMLNFLALMGWNPGNDVELFSLEDMISGLELKKIKVGGPVFDLVKLGWLNQQYLMKLEDQAFLAGLRERILSDEYLLKTKPLLQERINTFGDFVSQGGFFFNSTLDYAGLDMIPKGKDKPSTRKLFKNLVEALDEVYDWDEQTLEAVINKFKEDHELKPKEFFMPLRLIVTGRKDSPPLIPTMAVLGRDLVRFRIRDALVSAYS